MSRVHITSKENWRDIQKHGRIEPGRLAGRPTRSTHPDHIYVLGDVDTSDPDLLKSLRHGVAEGKNQTRTESAPLPDDEFVVLEVKDTADVTWEACVGKKKELAPPLGPVPPEVLDRIGEYERTETSIDTGHLREIPL